MEHGRPVERGGLTVRPDLLAPDPDLPQRDTLLDVSFVGERLPGLLGVPPGTPRGPVERIRAKYRVGRSLRVLHRLTIGPRTHLVSTRMATAERAPRLAAAAGAGSGEVAGLRAVVFDPDLHSVSWVFPCDRKLPGLDQLVGDGTLLRTSLGIEARTAGVVAYAPEKSVTLRCEDAAGRVTAYAKVYAEREQSADVEERYRRVAGPAAAVGVDVPRVIGYLPARHVVVLEAMRGRRLDELKGADLEVGLRGLGRALARLHGLSADAEEEFARFAPDAVRAAASLLGAVRPDVGTEAHALADRLADERPGDRSTLVHGDVHLKNGLLADEDVRLLDLDQCARGHPAADVGGLLAALRHRRLVGELARARFEHLEAAFLAGYAEHTEIDSVAMQWYTSAALLVDRAARAVHRVLPRTLARLPALLKEADRLLDRTGAR
jgi:Ser/Thr protein kinase RdoA (MazF antagonist)